MKVAHILGDLRYSGAERMLACSYQHWQNAGVEPVIVGMADGQHEYAPILAAAGYRLLLLPDARSARGLATLWRALRSLKPDVVHVHSERCFDAITYVAKATPAVKATVRTVHSCFDFDGMLRARRKARIALSNQVGLTWVAVSDDVALVEESHWSRPVRVIENWVDVEALATDATRNTQIRQQLGIGPKELVLALVGNCDIIKNHQLLVEALSNVELPLHVLHVGATDTQPKDEAAAWRRLPERHKAHHLGERGDVPSLLAASDLLAIPSLREGISLIAVEGICTRVPVLAANTQGLRWLGNVSTATLVRHDPLMWAAAISTGLINKPSESELAASAVTANSRFAPERGVAEYVNAYELGLAGDTRPRRYRQAR